MYIPIAISEEIREKPVSVELGYDKLVLFRDQNKKICALRDVCPHMNVSLSVGRIVSGRIQCAYHGLEFDGTGACVNVPSNKGGPLPSERVKSYVCVEAYGLIFLKNEQEGAQDNLPEIKLPKHGFWLKTSNQSAAEVKATLSSAGAFCTELSGLLENVFIHVGATTILQRMLLGSLKSKLKKSERHDGLKNV